MALGEAVLSAFLQVLLDRLASRELIDFFRRRDLDEVLLNRLRITLLAITAVLNDAEEKQNTNMLIKEWLVELKHVVYQAEDLLDLICTEALRCEAERDSESQSISKQVWNYITNSFFQFDRSIESKIEGLIRQLDFMANQIEILGLKKVDAKRQLRKLPTTSLLDEYCVYGRDCDREKMIKLLLSDDERRQGVGIIAIGGMGGIGKTTLAQLAYNDCRVKEQFALRAWACVSQEFDVRKVTKTILESVTSLTFETEDLDQLQVRLKQSLTGKKFLIVLDDLWNENYSEWDLLQHPFNAGMKGSKIIITVRNANAASGICTAPIHYLKPLSFEDCWLLFAKHAFADEDHSAFPNVEFIGKEIVEKCKGLPLAAKILGGLLRSKSYTEWENVLHSEIWDLPTDRCEILPVLRLSYHYLPDHLKRCFAYCSIFPKGFIFEKEKLVLLWMAESLLQQPRGRKMIEEVGNEYFLDLVSRSFFQPLGGEKSLFVMHDLINDLAQCVSGEFCFRFEGDQRHHELKLYARHSSYVQQKYDSYKRLEFLTSIKYLRTFLPLKLSHDDAICYISDKVLNDLLPTLTYLRVLSLSNYRVTSLPASISNLIYLRYLDLSHTAVRRLPESVTNLYNLQTLLLSFCYLTELPADFWKLINLRHLDLRGSKLFKMPLYMGKLRALQRLTNFVVGENCGSSVSELRELSHLRGELSISKLQNVVHVNDAFRANLKDKTSLDDLKLEWDNNNHHGENDMDVLDKLQPHRCLKKLSVKCYGGAKFPKWVGDSSYSKLAFLTLSSCKNCKVLPTLGHLPLLKDLTIIKMSGIKRVGPEFYQVSSSPVKTFQSLETLRFEEMMEWEDWVFLNDNESQGFPCLEELYLLNCPKLVSSLPRLPSLKKLELEECDNMLLTGISCLSSLVSLSLISGLASLPEGFLSPATTLKELKIAHCGDLSTLSNQVGFEGLSMLERFEISICPKLIALAPGLHKLTSIKTLRIVGCSSLASFPDTGLPSMLTQLIVEECEALQSIPGLTLCSSSSSAGLESSSLDLSSCCGVLPTALKELRIMDCKKLALLPEGMLCFSTTLEHFSVFKCHSVVLLSLHFLNLQYLDISGCVNLKSLPNGLRNLTSLKKLTIMNCPLLRSFPDGGLPTCNLTSLEINYCDNLESLPREIHTSESLQRLYLSHCPQLTSFPACGLPPNLKSLVIVNCRLLMPQVEWELHKLSCLIHFEISRCPNLESFPDEWLLPSSVSSLHIVGIPKLKLLPKAIEYLTSLETLEIGGCSNLLLLPELPTSISSLHIQNCPILRNRCRKDTGEDWHKICHIPCITINYVLIS